MAVHVRTVALRFIEWCYVEVPKHVTQNLRPEVESGDGDFVQTDLFKFCCNRNCQRDIGEST